MPTSVELKKIDENRYSLDVRGKVCPYPELLTLRALSSISLGDFLEVILDNPPSSRDIPKTLEERGYEKPEVSSIDGSWKIIIRVSKQE